MIDRIHGNDNLGFSEGGEVVAPDLPHAELVPKRPHVAELLKDFQVERTRPLENRRIHQSGEDRQRQSASYTRRPGQQFYKSNGKNSLRVIMGRAMSVLLRRSTSVEVDS